MSRDSVVGQTDTPGAGTEAEDAQDLDAILTEFESGTKPTGQNTASIRSKVESLADWAEEERATRAKAQEQQIVHEAAQAVKGELDVPVDFVETFVYGAAAKDPALAQAYHVKDQNPAAWAAAIKKMEKQFADSLTPIDREATEDRRAAVAAVRSASIQAPEPVSREQEAKRLSTMSDQDFANEIYEKTGA